jgi:hypothetical protein
MEVPRNYTLISGYGYGLSLFFENKEKLPTIYLQLH